MSPDLLEVSASVTDALCNGGFGSALVEITGGVESYDITYFENGLQLLVNDEYFNIENQLNYLVRFVKNDL